MALKILGIREGLPITLHHKDFEIKDFGLKSDISANDVILVTWVF